MMIVFAKLMACCSCTFITKNVWSIVNNIDNFAGMNWCKFIVYQLWHSANKWKEPGCSKKTVYGCPALLVVSILCSNYVFSAAVKMMCIHSLVQWCFVQLLEKISVSVCNLSCTAYSLSRFIITKFASLIFFMIRSGPLLSCYWLSLAMVLKEWSARIQKRRCPSEWKKLTESLRVLSVMHFLSECHSATAIFISWEQYRSALRSSSFLHFQFSRLLREDWSACLWIGSLTGAFLNEFGHSFLVQ